jgi:hypothetical protein
MDLEIYLNSPLKSVVRCLSRGNCGLHESVGQTVGEGRQRGAESLMATLCSC